MDKALRGGALRFRNRSTAAHDNVNFYSTVDVDIAEGSAVAWVNTMPHRVRRLVSPPAAGEDQSILRRTFLNFFILDPSAAPLPTCSELRQHPGDQWGSRELALQYRERLRKVMSKTQQGWGYGGYGNCGLYMANFASRAAGYADDGETWHRTDSDAVARGEKEEWFDRTFGP